MKKQPVKSDSEYIDMLGGTSAVARIFSISTASVSDWRKYGIPTARRQTLALLYPKQTPQSWKPQVA